VLPGIILITLAVQKIGRVEVLDWVAKRRVGIVVVLVFLLIALGFESSILTSREQLLASSPSDGLARTWFHVRGNAGVSPLFLSGLTPAQIKSAYKLPASGGAGTTIAIIDAYDDPTVASDLNVFSN
jgi:hypothetical protein